MSEIDWSRAPEGATHYNSDNDMFYKVEDGEVYHGAHGGGDWHVSAHSVYDFVKYPEVIPRPTKQEWEGGDSAKHVGMKFQTSCGECELMAVDSNKVTCCIRYDYDGHIALTSLSSLMPLKSKAERQRDELAHLIDENYGNSGAGIADAILSRYNLEPKP